MEQVPELHEKEVELIKLLRRIRFGEVTIKLRDGLPALVVEALKFHDLKPTNGE